MRGGAGLQCLSGPGWGYREVVAELTAESNRFGAFDPVHWRLRRNVRALLASLGQTSDAVSATLGTAGVNGTPRDPSGCAVSRYLSVVLATEPSVVSVTTAASWVELETTARIAPKVRVRLPRPVRRFVEAFDREQYPALLGNRWVLERSAH
jgi:hypothetical protein